MQQRKMCKNNMWLKIMKLQGVGSYTEKISQCILQQQETKDVGRKADGGVSMD